VPPKLEVDLECLNRGNAGSRSLFGNPADTGVGGIAGRGKKEMESGRVLWVIMVVVGRPDVGVDLVGEPKEKNWEISRVYHS
jgi:hypothetical protein